MAAASDKAQEKGKRAAVTRQRAKARAERAERAQVAARAWQESGRAPTHKGVGKGNMPKDVLSAEQVGAMLDACGAATSTLAIRNRAMIALLYGSAVRISEACDLRPADVALGGGEGEAMPAAVHINSGKGSKERTVGVRSGMVPYLVAWTERRASLGLNGRDPFFCAIAGASMGNPTSTSYWRHLLPRLADKAGIEGLRVHPHGMRRTAATHMRDAGIPLDVIQRQLGHANIATTQAYLAGRATPDHLQRVSEWGADDAAQAVQAPAVAAGDVVSLTEAFANSYRNLDPKTREAVSFPEYVAGSVSAWKAQQ